MPYSHIETPTLPETVLIISILFFAFIGMYQTVMWLSYKAPSRASASHIFVSYDCDVSSGICQPIATKLQK